MITINDKQNDKKEIIQKLTIKSRDSLWVMKPGTDHRRIFLKIFRAMKPVTGNPFVPWNRVQILTSCHEWWCRDSSTSWMMVQRFTQRHETRCRDSLNVMNDGAEIHATPWTLARKQVHNLKPGTEIHSTSRILVQRMQWTSWTIVQRCILLQETDVE